MPWTSDQLARFTRLVQDAVGFDASRGDSVSVINAPFAADSLEETFIDVPFYSQPWFWDIVKQVLGVLFILVLVWAMRSSRSMRTPATMSSSTPTGQP